MSSRLHIRPENENDISRINEIIKSAFENHPHSNQKEHFLVAALRDNKALTFSLVAERDGNILGHIAFSEVTINEKFCHWYGLAPVSVDTEHQNQGVGSRLINNGLARLKKCGAKGCVLVGEPAYYNRFGFRRQEKLTLDDIPEEYFLAKSFQKETPSGQVTYHPLFDKYS